MRDHDDLPYIVIERHSGGATPFLWGALIGAGVALLLAPRSGQETQDEIRRRAERLRTGLEDRVYTTRDNVTGAVTRTRDRFQTRLDTVRDAVESRTEVARNALDTGRRVARDARAELERRVAEAKQGYLDATDPARGDAAFADRARPDGDIVAREVDVVVTDVIVEEAEGRPDLG